MGHFRTFSDIRAQPRASAAAAARASTGATPAPFTYPGALRICRNKGAARAAETTLAHRNPGKLNGKMRILSRERAARSS